jgi:chromosome segregation ATPase
MKAFLVNLLILLALALCGFNAYQWQREARLRETLDQRQSALSQKSAEVLQLQQSLSLSGEEIKRLESLRESATSEAASNHTRLLEIEAEVAKLRLDLAAQGQQSGQVEQYKAAFDKANDNVRQQNQIIQSQNEKLKEVAAERNEIVGRFNKLASDYKTLSEDYGKVRALYTNLVSQVQAANMKK